MPSLPLSPANFEYVKENLNVEVIVPVLQDKGLLLPSDRDSLAKSKKAAVKIILRKTRHRPEVLCNALEETKELNEGHFKILQKLYTDSSLPEIGTGCSYHIVFFMTVNSHILLNQVCGSLASTPSFFCLQS